MSALAALLPLLRMHFDEAGESSLGFGLAGMVTLVVPFANFLLAPALAVGGTLLVLELEEDLVVPDRPAPPPTAPAVPPRLSSTT